MDTCESQREQLVLYALGHLDFGECREVEAHLERCQACRNELAAVRQALADLPLALDPVDPPDDLRARTLAALKATGDPRASTPPRRAREGRWMIWIAGAAAGILILVTAGLAWNVHRLNRQLSSLQALATEQNRSLRAAAERLADLRSAGVSLRPTEAAPGAHGYVALLPEDRGGLVVVTAEQLPKVAPGHVFHVWLIGDGQRVSAGVFHPDRDGRAALTLRWEGPFRFDEIGISVEPDALSDEPRGYKVLGGEF